MNKERLIYTILQIMKHENFPMGSSFLALKIPQVSQANIGRILQELEFSGFLTKVSNKGRILTEEGLKHFELLDSQMSSNEYLQDLYAILSAEDKQIYIDILKTRILLEEETVRLATENATEENLKDLRTILENQKYIQSLGGLGEEENLSFHSKLSEIAGNTIIQQVLKIIMHKKYAYKHFSVLQFTVSENSNSDHFKILTAMEQKDADKAVSYMYQHLYYLIDSIQRT